MPRRSKKTDTGRKKTTTVKTKNATVTQATDLDLNGSFLTPSGGAIVSTVPSPQPPPHRDPILENNTVLGYLQKIDATNQMLLKRVDELENQRATPPTTQATGATLGQGLSNIPSGTASGHPTSQQHLSATSTGPSQAGPSQEFINSTAIPGPAVRSVHNSQLHDAIIPDVNAIRTNPTISQSVSHILSSLEATSRAEATQGKVTHKKIREV